MKTVFVGLEAVPFDGDELLAMCDNLTGNVWVSQNRLCINLGLPLYYHPEPWVSGWYGVAQEPDVDLDYDTGEDETFLLRVERIPQWLESINPDMIRSVQLKAERYHAGLARALRQHFQEKALWESKIIADYGDRISQNEQAIGCGLAAMSTPKPKQYIERDVRRKLQNEIGGEAEVPYIAGGNGTIGYIDLMTDTEIIEVKRCDVWKDVIGQLAIYHQSHQDKYKRAHLFETAKYQKSDVAKRKIEHDLEINGIRTTWTTWEYSKSKDQGRLFE